MSDHVPFDIQSEIIKRLPVRAVLRGRSVCKLWKSLIDSPKFITSYHNTRPQHYLFVNYQVGNAVKRVLIVDDDTFPNQTYSLIVPESFSQRESPSTLSSVNGLLCVFGERRQDVTYLAVLWNPSVRKTVGITISNSLMPPTGDTHIGVGVCPGTSDPKLVKINTIGWPIVMNWEVEVFTLSTRVWKSVSNIPLAFKTCGLNPRPVCIGGFIYWQASSIKSTDRIWSFNLIISFDLKSDEFGEVCLPYRLVHTTRLESSKAYESLGLFDYYNQGETQFCDVWIMKEGVNKSFTKMLSIKAPDSWVRYSVLGFRKNGEAIIENWTDNTKLSSVLEVYDPSSGSISSMGISGAPRSISVYSYMETLLLLDESNSIIH